MKSVTIEQAKQIVQTVNERLYAKLPRIITETEGSIEITIFITSGGGQAKITYPPDVDSIKL